MLKAARKKWSFQLKICSHFLKKFSSENFIFWAMQVGKSIARLQKVKSPTLIKASLASFKMGHS